MEIELRSRIVLSRLCVAALVTALPVSAFALVDFVEIEFQSENRLRQMLQTAEPADAVRINIVLARQILSRGADESIKLLTLATEEVDAGDLVARAYLQANWCWTHLNVTGMDVAKAYCDSSLDIAKASQDSWALAKAYGAMALWYYQSGRLREAYVNAKHSVEQSLLTGESQLIATQYNAIGLIVRAQGAYRQSLDYFIKGLDVIDRHYHVEIHRILSFNVGLSYADLGKYELAKDFYLPALEWMRTKHNYTQELTALIYIGIADIALGQPELTARTLENALSREELKENRGYLGFAYAVIGEAYLAMGEVDKALKAYGEGRALAKAVPNTFEHRRLDTGYARALVEVGEYDQARRMLTQSIGKLREENSKQMLLESVSLLSELEERVGNYRASLVANKEARALAMDFQKQSLEHDLAVLRTDFELEEKELAVAQAERDRIIRNGVIGLMFALALMIYLLITRHMQMLRAREREEHASELERVVEERTRELEEKIVQANKAEEGRVALERQLGEAEKLRVLGQLTGGIAHDFNNLLTVVIGSTELLRARNGQDESNRALIEHILTAANAGADITKALMAYARKQPLQLENVLLNDYLRERTMLVRRTLGDRFTLKLDIDDCPPLNVVLDSSQLTTALLNLALNARDAQDRNGEVVISLEERAGRWAVISVRDQGKGMTEEQISRAVEPFYTTKDDLQGNGLGLSMVFGFSKQLGGDLEISSKPGEGTTVRIVLPLANTSEGRGSASLSLVK